MNFEKNEFVFGIHEIFLIFLKRIKLICCFVVLALGLNVGNYFLNNKTIYSDNVIMYTNYKFSTTDITNEAYKIETDYYKLQIRNFVNSLKTDNNFYENLYENIKVKNQKAVSSLNSLKKTLNFNYNEGASYFSFEIKYQCFDKNECFIVLQSAIETTINYASTIDSKLSVRYSTLNEPYKIENISVQKPKTSISKLSLVVLTFGIVLAFALELFAKKVKYKYVVENIVHPNYMIIMDDFGKKGDK